MKLLLLLLLLPTPVTAHLRTPFTPIEQSLRLAERLALVRVTGAPRPAGLGVETPVRRVEDVVGTSAARMTLYQEGPHQHALRAGDQVLAVLSRTPAGGWRYHGETRTPIRIGRLERRAALAFVRELRARAVEPPEAAVDTWIAWLDHPAEIARAVAYEALSTHAATLRPVMNIERIEALLDPILGPNVPHPDRVARIRLAQPLGGARAIDALAQRFDRLPSDRVRVAAAGALARRPTKAARAALRRCAATAAGSLGTRCMRLVARISAQGPTPKP